MKKTITSEIVVGYSQCPRKAFLLLCTSKRGAQHEYMQILEKQQQNAQRNYIDDLRQENADVQPYSSENLKGNHQYLVNTTLEADGFSARCAVLSKVRTHSAFGHYSYEPTIVVGSHTIKKGHRLEIFLVGHVLEQVQKKRPISGYIVGLDKKSHRVKLENSSKTLIPFLEPLQEWVTEETPESPSLILNKNCPLCQFHDMCREKAVQEDNLSLLDGISTQKAINGYEKKGLFTVKQLSYTFKPRKRKKRTKNPPPAIHKPELQALAIREQKIYLQELPELTRQPVELFLDIEGIPDQQFYYLIGLLVCENDTSTYYPFWANTPDDEAQIWQRFLNKVNQYPDAPIYHYGNYDARALTKLAKRYDADGDDLINRLVNVNKHIYGKVYFPVYSNRLKEIGAFIGATWTEPNATGLQSLVWRHHWDQKHYTKFRELLLKYNQEDCNVLRLLSEYLFKIIERYKELDDVVDIDRYKEKTTPAQAEISRQFKQIFKLAHFEYDKKKISFIQNRNISNDDQIRKQKQNARKAQHKKYLERKRRAKRKIQVLDGEFCPKCNYRPLKTTKVISRRYIIDLILTRNGIRKAITEYFGFKGYCTKCRREHVPPGIKKYGIKQAYGHGLRAWIVYQRIELRLSYDNIVRSLEEHFNESIRPSLCVDSLKSFGRDYSKTRDLILERLLRSPIIHADETRANIQGANWYVWVFTDEKNTVYQLHQSREAEIVQVFFANYTGVVISDFYAGYDSIECEQQKCWVHLIRDLNNDLRDNPFDVEFEDLVISIKNLIIPIMETVIQFGLKKRHLNKFKRQVNKFYKDNIDGKVFKSDTAQRYQKRFIRYRHSLFIFLKYDNVPWHNNTAESAIKHFAKQRDASGPMYESVTHDYLTLLSIHQTCRNHKKSFLQFLFSERKDVYAFERYKR